MNPIPNESLIIRFWSHVTKTDGCWIYGNQPFNFPRARYRSIRINNDKIRNKRGAHVVSWFIHYGVWPTKNVLHKCDNPPCVNPDHLFEGDQTDNMLDAKLKGRTRGGKPVGKYKGKFLKFSPEEVNNIHKRIDSGEKFEGIAKSLSCSRVTISHIHNGRRGYLYQSHSNS